MTFQFTMMLTIGLVVLVIFIFLRTLWATVIPSLAVPLSLLGTFASCMSSAIASTTYR